jgi:hypothetical protein
MERRIVTALSLLSELFDEALGFDDLPAVDHDVLLDQVDAAGRHVTNALFLHRPDLRRRPPEKRDLDALFARYPVELDHTDIDSLAMRAYDELAEILAARNHRVRREADHAMSHLDVVLLLLDPDMYTRAIETASSDDRVRLAAQAEQVELMLEEARAFVREDVM